MYIQLLLLFFVFSENIYAQQCVAEVTGSPYSVSSGAAPLAVSFSPITSSSNLFLALSSGLNTAVNAFSINTVTGQATAVVGSPFASGTSSGGIDYSPLAGVNLFAAVPNTSTIGGGNVTVYSVNTTTGAFTQVAGSPFADGGSPLRISFSPIVNSNLFAAVNDQIASAVTNYLVNTTTGAFSAADTQSVPNIAISVAYSPDVSGKLFLAVPSALANNISVFSVNTTTGALAPVPNSPFTASGLAFCVAYSPVIGSLLFACSANGRSDNADIFSVNLSTGEFTLLSTFAVAGTAAFSVAYSDLINGKLYAAIVTETPSALHIYSVNTTTGAFTEISGSPFATPHFPRSVSFSEFINYQLFIATANDGSNLTTTGSTSIFKMTFPPTLTNATQQSPCSSSSLVSVAGMAEPGVSLNILSDGNIIGSGSSDNTGNFSFSSTTTITQGTHAITVSQTSGACSGTSSNSINVDIFLAPILISVVQSSCINRLVTVTGTAEPNVTLNVLSDAVVIGSGTSDNAGNFSFSSTTSITTGTHAITVSQTSGTCNGSSSNSMNIDIQSTPVLTTAVQQNPCVNSFITVTGTSEANVTLNVLADAVIIGSGTSDNSGNFNFTSNGAISEGTHAITVSQTSGVCTGSSSNSINVNVHLSSVLISATQQSCLSSLITVSGTAEPGVTLEILADAQVIGSGSSDNAGNFNFGSTVPLTEGTHTIMIAQTSGVCSNTSSNNIVIDIHIGPLLSAVIQPSCLRNLITVSGLAEPAVTLNIFADGQPIGFGTSDSSGNFNFSSNIPIPVGTHTITVSQENGVCAGISSNSISIDVEVCSGPTSLLVQAIRNKYCPLLALRRRSLV